MTFAVYGGRTERAVQALLARRALEQRLAEQAERKRQDEERRAEAARQEHARLMALAEAELEAIRVEEAIRSTKSMVWNPPRMETIKRRAAKLFGVTVGEIDSPCRNRLIMPARLFCYYWSARLTKLSYPQIGQKIGGRDHTTVLSGVSSYRAKRAAMGRTLRKAR